MFKVLPELNLNPILHDTAPNISSYAPESNEKYCTVEISWTTIKPKIIY